MLGLAVIGLPIMNSLNVSDRTIVLPVFISIAILGFAMQIAGLLTERAKMLALDVRFHSEIDALVDGLGSSNRAKRPSDTGANKNAPN